MVQKESQPRIKSVGQWPIFLAVAMVALATGAISVYSLSRFRSSSESSAPATPTNAPAISAVTGLGRLEPKGEVIHLSAPTFREGAQVVQILVKEGDKVHAGQVIAMLESYQPRLAALNQAKQQVKIAQAVSAKVRAGAQAGEIAAQEATIARLEVELRGETAAQKATIARLGAELSNALAEFRRYQELYQDGAISASLFDSKRLAVETVREQSNEAKATLNHTVKSFREQISQAKATLSAKAEVRPVDVEVAQTEVDGALAAVKRAQADLNLAYVRAPVDSQILKIHTRPGEIVNNQGIAELGQTDQMYAAAEIYETDIGKVRIGQSATVTSEAFSGKLEGKVVNIGLQVSKQDIFNVNPTADTDRKVVEVKIQLNDLADNLRVAGLTNLQVQVAIHI